MREAGKKFSTHTPFEGGSAIGRKESKESGQTSTDNNNKIKVDITSVAEDNKIQVDLSNILVGGYHDPN